MSRFLALDMCKFAATCFVSSSLLCAEKRQKEQTNWQIQRLCQTDLAHFFVETGAGKARNALWRFSLELTETARKRPLVERLSQALNGRFPCFAPKSHLSPQKSSNIRAIYYLPPLWRRAGLPKTAHVLFTVGITTRWVRDGITANAAMPGPVPTNFQRNMNPDRLRQRLGGRNLGENEVPAGWKTPQQGAATSVLLAVSPLLKGVGGRYFEDCNETVIVANNNGYRSGVAPYALDSANADRLWEESLRLLASADRSAVQDQ
jgi:hypothetical protein